MSNSTKFDSITGLAMKELTCEAVMEYGRALCLFIAKKTDRKPVVLVARDTRLSSEVLESALSAGISSAGGDCIKLGIVPLPAVSYLIKKHKADAGMMLCAGNATAEYNGIRLFSSSGFYFSEDELDAIETLKKDSAQAVQNIPCDKLGRQIIDTKAQWDYNRHIISQINTHLHGAKIVIDCANGAASFTAKNIFEGLGAFCTIINDNPDGNNINAGCGISNTENLKKYVVENHYALGIAFDGDGSKIAVIDETGALVDSDRLLNIFAYCYGSANMLKNNTIINTMMTNLGVANFCEANGYSVVTAKTGERYVAEKMLKCKYSLGGDPNGHIFFEADVPISDAQLTGVKLLEVLLRSGKKISELAAIMERCSQVLLNIKINPKCKEVWKNDKKLSDYIEKCSLELGKNTRVIVRECGSEEEPAICVLVEGRNFDDINKYALLIADKIKERVRPPKTNKKS